MKKNNRYFNKIICIVLAICLSGILNVFAGNQEGSAGVDIFTGMNLYTEYNFDADTQGAALVDTQFANDWSVTLAGGGTAVVTSCTDAFYLWRKGSYDLFWTTVTSANFEQDAKDNLIDLLSKHSKGNFSSLISGYVAHLRRFRRFLEYDNKDSFLITEIPRSTMFKEKTKITIPTPSVEQIEIYLKKWESTENYSLQEQALNKLFCELCPKNSDIKDILLKCSTLNDFYSTNIFSVYPVAKHIFNLHIDSRLMVGDPILVNDIKTVSIGNATKNFYSFATKYCSHHNPKEYPIYDSYVDEVLRYFECVDKFSTFSSSDLKNYVRFKEILIDFKRFYGLDNYSLKQIDQYLWQIGKEYFPKRYKNNVRKK